MIKRHFIHYLFILTFLFCSQVFADGTGFRASGGSVLGGLKNISGQNLNLPVKGHAVEMAISTANNMTQGTGTRTGGRFSAGMEVSGTEFVLKRSDTDKLGYKQIRLDQHFKGLPVIGAECIVHIDKQNVICQTSGKYCSDINISIKADIQAEVAMKIGLDEHKGKAGLQVSKKPSLVIYGSHLAYHYVVSYKDEEAGQWWYYIDAHTGKLIYRYNNIQHPAPNQNLGFVVGGVGGYRLAGEDGSNTTMNGFYEISGSGNTFLYNFNEKWGVYDTDELDWEQQPSSNWGASDPAAISAGRNVEDTQHWVTHVLGRNSYDNFGSIASVYVHEGTNVVNAYWDGTGFYFGDGDGITANALTVLDVVAHEYGHAITQYTSNLVYSFESGALNESFSDIMGTLVEFAKQPGGTAGYPDATPGHSDWLMGEDCWLPNTGDALRDISNPQKYQQPSYYQGTHWYTGSGDNGGVHTNSGVQNFAFYLLAVGGSGANDGHTYGPITGLGVVAAGEIAMRANMVYLVSSSQYPDTRDAWISAAQDLGYPTATVAAVWDACGVVPFSTDPFEPDDRSQQATSIISGNSQTHSINPVGDEDWLTFTLADDSGVTIETSGSSGDTRMWLYDSGLNQVEYNDDGGTGYFSLINRVCNVDALPAGTYYIKIDEYGDNHRIDSYDISLTVASCCSYSLLKNSEYFTHSGGIGNVSITTVSRCSWTATSDVPWITITSGSSGNGNGTVDYSVSSSSSTSQRVGTMTIAGGIFTVTQNVQGTYEPNDSSGQATIITPGSPQTHSISPVGDEDWMTFTLSHDSGVTIETSGLSGDTRMWLYDSGLNQVEYNDDGGAGYFSYIDRVCDVNALPAGTYYIKIDEYGDNHRIDSYDVSLNAVSCSPQPTHTAGSTLIPTGDIDGNGKDDAVMCFGNPWGTYTLYNGTTYVQIHSSTPEIMETGDIDGNGQDDVIIGFGDPWGTYIFYNGTTWAQIHSSTPETLNTGDCDGNGKDDVIMGFGDPFGTYIFYNGTTWTQIHSSTPEIMKADDLDGNGQSDVVLGFGDPWGTYVYYNSSTWVQIHSSTPEIMETGDCDGNGADDVIMGFGIQFGTYIFYNGTTWTQIHSSTPEIMSCEDVDGNGRYDVVMGFGNRWGTYVYYNGTTWTQIHSSTPEIMGIGDCDGNGGYDIIMGFGNPWGTYIFYNNTTWVQTHSSTPVYSQ